MKAPVLALSVAGAAGFVLFGAGCSPTGEAPPAPGARSPQKKARKTGPAHVAAPAKTDWPAFRGGPRRRGFVPGAKDPVHEHTVWSHTAEKTFYSSPTVVGDRVYATFVDYGPFNDRGAILCLDADTGAGIWRYDAKRYRATFSSPSVKDGYVVCGEGLHMTADARIVCLTTEGKEVWTYRTKSHVESSPCIYKGRVYIGAGDDGYYGIDLKPKEDGTPNVVWHLRGARYRDCESSPIAHDGVVYLGLGTGGNAIVAVSADSGEELWRLPTPYPVYASASVADEKLYVGMGNGDFVFSAEEARTVVIRRMREAGKSKADIEAAVKGLGPAGEVWCVDLATHKVDWKFGSRPEDKLKRNVLGAIAVGKDRLYFGSRDKHLYCLSASGTLIAWWNAARPLLTSPALADEHVYVVTGDGFLHCLTAGKLEPVWRMRLGEGELFVSSPTVARGHVYVGTPHNGLRCLGLAGVKPPVVWSCGEQGGPADSSPLPPRAKRIWYYPQAKDPTFRVTAPLMSLGKSLYVPCTRGGKPELLKLKAKDPSGAARRRIGDAERALWSIPLKHSVSVPPAGAAESIYVVDGAPGDRDRALHSINPETGAVRWQIPVQPRASGRVGLDSERLAVWTGPTTVSCYQVDQAAKPTRVWEAQLGGGRMAPAVHGNFVLVATDAELAALNKGTGTPGWADPRELPGKPICGPLPAGDSVIVTTATTVSAYAARDGSERWSVKLGPIGAPPVADRRKVAIVTKAGSLVVLNLADGRELRRVAEATDAVPPLLGSGRIVFCGASDLMALDNLKQERPSQWAWIEWMGSPRTPLLLLDSRVYFSTSKYGVVCLGSRVR